MRRATPRVLSMCRWECPRWSTPCFCATTGLILRCRCAAKWGDFAVNRICEEHFNGGGHRNAAGGEFYGTLQEAVDRFMEIMPDYDCYLPKKQNHKK